MSPEDAMWWETYKIPVIHESLEFNLQLLVYPLI